MQMHNKCTSNCIDFAYPTTTILKAAGQGERSLSSDPPSPLAGSPPVLRPYQTDALALLDDAVARGSRAPLLVLPTGSGKTVIAADLMRREVDRGGSAVFLAPRRELVAQTSQKLSDVGVRHGVILAGEDSLRDIYAPAQVASIDTLLARAIRRKRMILPEYSLVIVDEAHLSVTTGRQKLLACWPNALRIGLTATPTRKDGRALGLLYDALIEPVTVGDLIDDGYLVSARYFSLSEPDLSRVRTVAGDYHAGDLERAVNRVELVGDVVQHWLEHAAGRRTIVFCCTIAHSAAMAEEFLRAGVAAEHVDANTPQPDRAATFERFRSGATQLLTNCFLASYGFDLPALACVVLARPTKSLMLYLQMLGRGLRIAEDKTDCLVLDHSGCVHRHGFAHDERPWTLDGEFALDEAGMRKTKEASDSRIDCPECAAVFAGTRTCPECGYVLRPSGKMVETLDGELVEIGTHLSTDQQDRLAFYLELRGFALERGFKPGWPAHKFKEAHGNFPPWPWNDLPAAIPSLVTRRWVKSRQIAWGKSRRAAC